MIEQSYDKYFSKNADFNLTWKNVDYNVAIKDKATKEVIEKKILSKVSGHASSGQLTAIMGPSGCGKSSLLNFLNDNIEIKEGSERNYQMFLNNKEVAPKEVSKYSSYVMQDDVLLDILKPEEVFSIAARLIYNKSASDVQDLVELMLDQLKLVKCRSTVIGNERVKGISGGERKRVSIGVELISNSPIIFLDEPTSGLDSRTSHTIISYLKGLAEKFNKGFILTIHQPSSNIFNLFDNLIILNAGRNIYQGNPQALGDHFAEAGRPLSAQANPADAFMHVLEGLNKDEKEKEELGNFFDQSKRAEIESQIDEFNKTAPTEELQTMVKTEGNFLNESLVLTYRSWLNIIRNPLIVKLRFGMTIFFCFLCASVYWRLGNTEEFVIDKRGFLLFFGISVYMSNIFSVVLAFPLERKVFLREYNSGLYSVEAYYLAKNLIETPYNLILTIIFVIPTYFLVGLREDGWPFISSLMAYMCMSQFSQSSGYAIGALFSDVAQALIITQATLIPNILFSGIVASLNTLPVYISWVPYISAFRYMLEITMRNEFEDNDEQPFGESIPKDIGYTMGIGWCFLVLLTILSVLRIAGLFILKALVKKTG